jgi:hypothetical protein
MGRSVGLCESVQLLEGEGQCSFEAIKVQTTKVCGEHISHRRVTNSRATVKTVARSEMRKQDRETKVE